jgi:hypothetical protein
LCATSVTACLRDNLKDAASGAQVKRGVCFCHVNQDGRNKKLASFLGGLA